MCVTEVQVTREEGKLWEPWWRQTRSRKELSATLKEILADTRERRWKSGRCGDGGGGDR